MEKQILEDNDIVRVMHYINEDDIVFFENKVDCIKYLIDLYIEDIYEEFASYIRRREYIDMTLYEYVEYQYVEKYFKFKDFYVVDPYDYCDIPHIEKLFNMSNSNNFNDLINFCEEYEDIIETHF